MSNRIAVVYYFYYDELDRDVPNLKHFLDNGLSDDIDYYFYHASDWPVSKINRPNVLYIPLKNSPHKYYDGYRLGAHFSYSKKYHYTFFINSSIKVPIELGWNNFISRFDDITHILSNHISEEKVDSSFLGFDDYALELSIKNKLFDQYRVDDDFIDILETTLPKIMKRTSTKIKEFKLIESHT